MNEVGGSYSTDRGTGGYRLLVRKEVHLEDLRLDGRIILIWFFRKWDGAWALLIWLSIEKGGGLL